MSTDVAYPTSNIKITDAVYPTSNIKITDVRYPASNKNYRCWISNI